MAQPGAVHIEIDTTAARKKLRSLMSITRDLNAELTALDEQLGALQTKADELADYGIRLEVVQR